LPRARWRRRPGNPPGGKTERCCHGCEGGEDDHLNEKRARGGSDRKNIYKRNYKRTERPLTRMLNTRARARAHIYTHWHTHLHTCTFTLAHTHKNAQAHAHAHAQLHLHTRKKRAHTYSLNEFFSSSLRFSPPDSEAAHTSLHPLTSGTSASWRALNTKARRLVSNAFQVRGDDWEAE